MLLNNWFFWVVLAGNTDVSGPPYDLLRDFGPKSIWFALKKEISCSKKPPRGSNEVRATPGDRQGSLPLPNGNVALRDLKVFRGSFPIGTKWRPRGRDRHPRPMSEGRSRYSWRFFWEAHTSPLGGFVRRPLVSGLRKNLRFAAVSVSKNPRFLDAALRLTARCQT